ncbi:MAG: hypothetical protein ACI379_03280 [Nocardioides sp.]|uniref:hypothetical protein n=1 Tax=Nocardioides sp. TaxID=35761 RepID=UPI003F05C713
MAVVILILALAVVVAVTCVVVSLVTRAAVGPGRASGEQMSAKYDGLPLDSSIRSGMEPTTRSERR